MARRALTILEYGDTGDGKTAHLGEWAEWKHALTGRKMLLYTADPGGAATIEAQVDLGLIDLVDCASPDHPFEMLAAVTAGKRPTAAGGWEAQSLAPYHTIAYEGLTSFSDMMMQYLSNQASLGNIIGGQKPNVMFSDNGQKVAGSAPAHFGVVQTDMTKGVQGSFYLPVDTIIWTARARRGTDGDTTATVLGPQVAGKALTAELPGWFVYTFRTMAVPADPVLRTPGSHKLYVQDHNDMTLPGAKGLGNNRLPLGVVVPEFEKGYIEPASLVAAMQLIEKAKVAAKEVIQARVAAFKAAAQNATS